MRIRRIGLALVGVALASVSLVAPPFVRDVRHGAECRVQRRHHRMEVAEPARAFQRAGEAGAGIDPKTAGTWDVEGGSINIMSRQGWTRASYKVGDPIRLVGHPMKDGSKGISLFYAIRPDGSRLYHDIARPKDDVKK